MARPTARSIVTAPAEGAWNMALDEVLLRGAASEGTWTLRFYGWSQPTLSLGYFQPWDDRRQHAPSRSCACVRRPSGGGAILHDRELTYSLAVPAGHPLAASAETLYRQIHQSLAALLNRFAIEAEIYAAERAERSRAEPFLCFERRAPGDVVVGGVKVAGSAQRRWRGAVLQHGSVLLQRSSYAPELRALGDLKTSLPGPYELADDWLPMLTESLGVEFRPDELSAIELTDACQLASDKYQVKTWNRRR
jgi:lipoate-protein ligase A